MSELWAAVDVGTTHLKTALFDAGGARVAFAQRACPPRHGPGGTVTVDPEAWWRAFEAAFAETLAAADPGAVGALAVSGQAQTYVLLDDAGRPRGPAVSWLDTTGDTGGAPADGYYARVGWPAPFPMLASCKLRRRGAGPDAWRGARRLVFADGYLLFRLAGRCAVSRNLAAMSGLYSMKTGDWWPEAVRAARVPPALLPDLCDVGAAVGTLRPELAARWGLPAVPVVAGANDQTAAAVGAGLAAPGDVAAGLGTALVVYQVAGADAPVPASRPLRGPYPGGLEYRLAVLGTGCAVLDWACQTLGGGRPRAELLREALAVPPGCEGVRLAPDFSGTPGGGVFNGLRLGHGRAHMIRAVLEGLACAAREMLDDLAAGPAARVTGGGAACDGWMQILADVTGRRIERLDLAQATLAGTALMAGRGAGRFGGLLEAAAAWRRDSTVFAPRAETAAACGRLLADARALREAAAGY